MAEQETRERRPRSSSGGGDDREESRDRRRGGRGGGGRDRFRRRRHCAFCADKTLQIDYKQADALRYYITDHGKIRPRRQTGVCARHQRRLSIAIKRARHLALLPFSIDPRRHR